MSDVSKPVGFKRTEKFGSHTIGWRGWFGPLCVARAKGVRKPWTWVSHEGDWHDFEVAGLGLAVSLTFRKRGTA